MSIDFNCAFCGKVFNVKPSRALTARFCSRKCKDLFRRNDKEDFDALVDRSDGPNACWPWLGTRFDKGFGFAKSYGAYSHKGKTRRAHRWAYFYAYGVLPSGVARHTCDNPPCCNPKHILDGTQLDNVADRDRRKRTARGMRSGMARLTDAQVRKILKDPRQQRTIARDYSVCKSTIGYIKRRENWRHVN